MAGTQRTRPGEGNAFPNSVTFGIEGSYDDAQSAIDAYSQAYNDPINGVWGTTGAGAFFGKRGIIGDDGKWYQDGYIIGNGSVVGWGFPFTLPGYKLGQVNIAQQEQAPDNPGIRLSAFSTYGVPIPVSIGRRAITGNVIDASPIVPVMIGTYDYWVEYKIPIYETGGPA